ncbi:MAG: pitrilysin family protein [Planctomycetota bacterium]
MSEARVHLDVHRRALPGGLVLLAARKTSAPTVALSCAFEVSRMHDPADKPGLAHFVGQSLDEGTRRRSGDELAELVEGYGGHLGCGGNGASVQFAVEDVEAAADVLAEVVREPSFPAKEVERVRKLVLAEIQADLDEPRTVASQEFRRRVYGDHPFGVPVKGTAESVAAISRADLEVFHATWFRPDNAVIAAVGDLEPEALLDLCEARFADWDGHAPAYPGHGYPQAPAEPRRLHIAQDKQQVQVFLGHLGVRRGDPDFYKLRVMDHVLGSGPGFTSRIARKLRDEQGLCYAVGAGITGSAGHERGVFSAYIGTSPGQEERAVEGLLAEVRAIRDEPPGEQELADVHAYLTGSFVWALERNAHLAGFLVRLERFDLGLDHLDRLPGLIRGVTRDDVRAAAEAHLDPSRYDLVTLGPVAAGAAAARS